ncbi:hypothetical protein V8F20_005359 [Naviculisporaceae sp. PSN 640]
MAQPGGHDICWWSLGAREALRRMVSNPSKEAMREPQRLGVPMSPDVRHSPPHLLPEGRRGCRRGALAPALLCVLQTRILGPRGSSTADEEHLLPHLLCVLQTRMPGSRGSSTADEEHLFPHNTLYCASFSPDTRAEGSSATNEEHLLPHLLCVAGPRKSGRSDRWLMGTPLVPVRSTCSHTSCVLSRPGYSGPDHHRHRPPM